MPELSSFLSSPATTAMLLTFKAAKPSVSMIIPTAARNFSLLLSLFLTLPSTSFHSIKLYIGPVKCMIKFTGFHITW
ncbi:hypothetical protein ASG14_14965 [Pedobacter sp. Leaf194]|nr:hypothetical protein ASG14_14965 [Pedobacter sp. Leaf194]